ncbi:Hsp20/alpha crystallin family protein [bacterium]|nr:Hsp20/alpha crystallin family protein [bacterium]
MLMRWDPFAEMNRLHDELAAGSESHLRAFRPAVDIRETDEAFVLHVEVPGLDAKEIHVDVDGGVLRLHGERKLEHEEEKDGYRRIERSFGSFERAFTLPDVVDTTKIDAKLENGVLALSLPKKAREANTHRVEIHS